MVILGAAFVALICDLLKGNNEQLRELAIELKVRREEERRHSQMMNTSSLPPANRAVRERLRMEQIEQERTESRERVEAPASRSLVNRVSREKRAPSAEALAAMKLGEQLAASPRRRKPAAEAAPAPVVESAPVIENPVIAGPPVAAEPAPAPKQITLVAKSSVSISSGSKPASGKTTSNKKDWAALLSKNVQRIEAAEATVVDNTLLDAVCSETATQSASSAVPAGFHENYVL